MQLAIPVSDCWPLGVQVPGYYFSIDSRGRLQEVGWAKIPTLRHLTWAAQWLQYTARLERHLERAAVEVPVFGGEVRAVR
jgi:hypothetical protein